MPDYSTYPSAGDVRALLQATGLTLPQDLAYEVAIADAIEELERRTGWYPFLAREGYSTRLFDPPRSGPVTGLASSAQGGKILDLDGGIIDMPDDGLRIGYVPNTQYMVGVNEGLTSSSGSQGAVLTRGIQYYLRPNNAPQQNLPWTEVEFLTPTRGVPQSIVINARWGRVGSVPPDVWRAIQQKAAALLMAEVGLNLTKGAGAIKDQTLDIEFVTRSGLSQTAQSALKWEADFDKTVSRWRRIVV